MYVVAGDFVAAPEPVRSLHQLPPPPADFTCRAAELADLTAFVTVRRDASSPGPILLGINGMGGVGKTALALRLAGTLKTEFPDADFYFDLNGTAVAPDKPLPPEEALRHIIRAATGVEQTLPDSLPVLKARFHSCIAGQRAVILWDNARDAAQLAHLVPPAGCVMLVTSRARLTLPGMHVASIDVLPSDDAVTLLQGIAGSAGRTLSRTDAAELARLCGFLSQALRLAGGALAARADLSPADLIRRLSERDQQLRTLDRYKDDTAERSIRVSMEMTEGLLAEDDRARWHALSVCRASFDVRAAAALWRDAPYLAAEAPDDQQQHEWDRAADRLGNLVRANAVEFDASSRRYRLHDLTRAYGYERLPSDARAACEQRFVEYFVHLAVGCEALYLTKGQHAVALARFDADWPNVVAAFELAEPRVGSEPWAAEAVKQLVGRCGHCLGLRLMPSRRSEWAEAGLRAARATRDRIAEMVMLARQGDAYASSGHARSAVESYEGALAIARDTGDRAGEGVLVGNLGNALQTLGEVERARQCYATRLAVAREFGDRREEAGALGDMGRTLHNVGDARGAIPLLQQALAISRDIGDRRGEGLDLANLGNALASLGEHRQAQQHAEQALAIMRELGDRRMEGGLLGAIGRAHAARNEPDQALRLYRQQLDIARQVGDLRSEAEALGDIGLLYGAAKNVTEAIEVSTRSLSIMRLLGNRRGEANALMNFARAYSALDEFTKAIEPCEKSLEILREIGDRNLVAALSWNLGCLYTNTSDAARAPDLMQVAVEYKRQMGHPDAEEHAAVLSELRAKLSATWPGSDVQS